MVIRVRILNKILEMWQRLETWKRSTNYDCNYCLEISAQWGVDGSFADLVTLLAWAVTVVVDV